MSNFLITLFLHLLLESSAEIVLTNKINLQPAAKAAAKTIPVITCLADFVASFAACLLKTITDLS